MVRMSAGTKKCLIVVFAAFILFFLISRPTKSADVVHTSLGGLRDGADSVIAFVSCLFSSGESSDGDEVVVDSDVKYQSSDHRIR